MFFERLCNIFNCTFENSIRDFHRSFACFIFCHRLLLVLRLGPSASWPFASLPRLTASVNVESVPGRDVVVEFACQS